MDTPDENGWLPLHRALKDNAPAEIISSHNCNATENFLPRFIRATIFPTKYIRKGFEIVALLLDKKHKLLQEIIKFMFFN